MKYPFVNKLEIATAPDGFSHGTGAAQASELFERALRSHRQERFDEALTLYQGALEAAPGLTEAIFNMGIIHLSQSNWQQSTILFKLALDLNPDFPDAAFHLATALRMAGHHDKALAIYQMSLELDANRADAHYFIGICHQHLGAPMEAVRSMNRAAAMDPANATFWFHLAEANLLANRMAEAIQAYRKAIDLRPDWASAHHNMAVALRLSERVTEAMAHLKTAIEIDPGHVTAYPLLYRLAQHACDWPLAQWVSRRLDEIGSAELSRGVKTTEPPMTNIRRCADVRTNMNFARSWSEHVLRQATANSPGHQFIHAGAAGGKLRVGYLSADFKDHAVAHQIRGLFEHHDRNRFEIHGYAVNPDDGTAYRGNLARACDHFTDVHAWSNLAVARQINRDGIHILVDMAGHTRDNRLGIAAMRPAPVQVSYLGFLSTTGATFIDYAIADPIVVPEAHAQYYSEKIAYLPHCYQANDNRLPADPPQSNKRQYDLPDQSFVYCSFNQPYKIDEPLFHMWMRILQQVDRGVLWLVERSPAARDNLRHAAGDLGVDPRRLVFAGFEPLAQNLARLQLADLVLDTLTYNGGATTSNALWAGVPVLTTLGSHWVSRMSASALHAVGLPELIARDTAEYERRAVALAQRPSQLTALRQRLERQRLCAPLFDTPGFTRHLEQAYTHMWQRHITGMKPASFRIDP